MKFRVLWIDAAGEGRFTTVEAANAPAAAWTVAIMADSQSATFEAIEQIGKAERATGRGTRGG